MPTQLVTTCTKCFLEIDPSVEAYFSGVLGAQHYECPKQSQGLTSPTRVPLKEGELFWGELPYDSCCTKCRLTPNRGFRNVDGSVFLCYNCFYASNNK